jgi:hypothetical protein
LPSTTRPAPAALAGGVADLQQDALLAALGFHLGGGQIIGGVAGRVELRAEPGDGGDVRRHRGVARGHRFAGVSDRWLGGSGIQGLRGLGGGRRLRLGTGADQRRTDHHHRSTELATHAFYPLIIT